MAVVTRGQYATKVDDSEAEYYLDNGDVKLY
jgi:hypothetical protein